MHLNSQGRCAEKGRLDGLAWKDEDQRRLFIGTGKGVLGGGEFSFGFLHWGIWGVGLDCICICILGWDLDIERYPRIFMIAILLGYSDPVMGGYN